MKKIKKLIVLAMATSMLFGATLTVHAANCPPHNWVDVSWYGLPCPQGHMMHVFRCTQCGGTEVRCLSGHY